jgi:hypothetical protein
MMDTKKINQLQNRDIFMHGYSLKYRIQNLFGDLVDNNLGINNQQELKYNIIETYYIFLNFSKKLLVSLRKKKYINEKKLKLFIIKLKKYHQIRIKMMKLYAKYYKLFLKKISFNFYDFLKKDKFDYLYDFRLIEDEKFKLFCGYFIHDYPILHNV